MAAPPAVVELGTGSEPVAAEFDAPPTRGWKEAIDSVMNAVVCIRTLNTIHFDTSYCGSSQATGFVVHLTETKGLILTNRHVVTTGPIIAEAVFQNHEVISIYPEFRDPVHDFGFFRFDPRELVHLEPKTVIPLNPAGATVGTEIRVVGNDDGEKLSILSGTLARVDRSAPFYGRGQYNDFNTFYLQAASSTSGGSSGSPVIDIAGSAVGLNAGGSTTAASSFYLPLDRVVVALDALVAGDRVSRGTLQTEFMYRSYDELKGVGFRPESEAATRSLFPNSYGLLVVHDVGAGGPGDGNLVAGDVLTKINGEPCENFNTLAAVLDESVGGTVELTVERGGVEAGFTLPVVDLDSITPNRIVSIGSAKFNSLSYGLAMGYALPAGTVHLVDPGFMLRNVSADSVVTAINGQPTPDLDALIEVISGLGHGAVIVLEYFNLFDKHTPSTATATVDRLWFEAMLLTRVDSEPVWRREPLAVPEPYVFEPGPAFFPRCNEMPTRALVSTLVMVRCELPYTVSGLSTTSYVGVGMLVDTELGLVVADRNTVNNEMSVVTVDFGFSFEVPAEVSFLHPTANYALVKYNPDHIIDTALAAAPVYDDLPPTNSAVHHVCLTGEGVLVTRRCSVTEIRTLLIPPYATPHYRMSHYQTIILDNAITTALGGVVADDGGKVWALWGSYQYESKPNELVEYNSAIPLTNLNDILGHLRSGVTPYVRDLGAELGYYTIAEARHRNLGVEWIQKFDETTDNARVLRVVRRCSVAPAYELLAPGDLILTINGEVPVSFNDVHRLAGGATLREPATQPPSSVAVDTLAGYDTEQPLAIKVLRNGEEIDLELAPVFLKGRSLERTVAWAGCIVQPTCYPVVQCTVAQEGVYVSCLFVGSPAQQYGLAPATYITAINGEPTPNIDAFLAAALKTRDGEYARVLTSTRNGEERMKHIRPNSWYFPTVEYRFEGEGWVRKIHREGGDEVVES